MSETRWKTYEGVAAYLRNQLRDKFGLAHVEPKQDVPGFRSGTKWEIDAKGILKGGAGFLIIECRRHTTSKLDQKNVGALYQIAV